MAGQHRVAGERLEVLPVQVSKACDEVARTFDEPLDLEALARAVGCSPGYLSRTFSKHMGLTLRRYQRRVRIERAILLMRGRRGLALSEVGVEVGYRSASHFSQAFRAERGISPSAFGRGVRG